MLFLYLIIRSKGLRNLDPEANKIQSQVKHSLNLSLQTTHNGILCIYVLFTIIHFFILETSQKKSALVIDGEHHEVVSPVKIAQCMIESILHFLSVITRYRALD